MLSEPSTPTIGRAKALLAKGYLLWSSTAQSEARPYLEQAAGIAKELGEESILAYSKGLLGAVVIALGDYDSARVYLQESLAMGRRLAFDRRNIVGKALCFLADIPFAQGDDEAARRLYEEAAAVARELNDINTLTYCSRRLGYVALILADYSKAAECFSESLRWNQQIRHLQGINRCIAAFASMWVAQGKLVEAAQLCGAVEGFLSARSASLFYWDAPFFNRSLIKLRGDLPKPVFERAWSKGYKMTLDQAVEFALGES